MDPDDTHAPRRADIVPKILDVRPNRARSVRDLDFGLDFDR